MGAGLIEKDQPEETELGLWEAPRVIRFDAAGAMAGDTVSSADSTTDKS